MKNTNKTMATTMVPDNAHKDIPGNPSTAKSSQVQLRKTATADTLRVLTPEQWEFWLHNGYVVVKNAVPREQAQATADFLWEFEEKQADNPDTWYTAPRAEMQMKELAGTGMVEAITTNICGTIAKCSACTMPSQTSGERKNYGSR